MSSDRNIETFSAEWNGILINITWEENWLNPDSGYDLAHLDIETVQPARAKLPITETGYLSHFTSAEAVNAHGGPVGFVLAWLNDAAQTPEWRKSEAEARQFALF